ncbi:MAG TPA: glycosyltransferase, partial [Lachnospiraceae bacterium]|nr:glycosyltransferase [Lachnospiraceae bacterium]
MKVKTLTFFSNYFNHHQKALCDEWSALLGAGFTFVETEPIEGFRASMGWGEKEYPSYVLRTYADEASRQTALRLGLESDVVVMGTAPEFYIEARLAANKLTFRYSERPLKEGFIKFFIPRLTKKYIRLHIRNRKKPLYILGASAYTAQDYKKMRSYLGKCYKFGYFPKHIDYEPDQLTARKKEKAGSPEMTTILWEGRMLKLKRPDLVIKAASRLKRKGYQFHVTMVGEGEERMRTERLAEKYGLSGIVSFENFLSPAEARERMADAKVYVMTSNFWEGWGSVIYEALNAGCAVVASHACGATPWLVEHEKTGLVFKSGSVKSLTEQLEKLLKQPSLQEVYGTAAYGQMHRLWNPKTAAGNVLTLAECLSEGKTSPFEK